MNLKLKSGDKLALGLMELDPLYCDVIVQRYEQFSGVKADRVAPGA
jgi:hypothetical protein